MAGGPAGLPRRVGPALARRPRAAAVRALEMLSAWRWSGWGAGLDWEVEVRQFTNAWGDLGGGELRSVTSACLVSHAQSAQISWGRNFREG